jgi:hypothetical protein
VLKGTPLLPQSGQWECAEEVSWDLPSLAPGATALIDVAVNGARAGDLARTSLVPSPQFSELDAAVWANNTARVMARNISGATFDLAAATLSAGIAKRRVDGHPRRCQMERARSCLEFHFPAYPALKG